MNYDPLGTDAPNKTPKISNVKRPASNIADRNTPLINNCWYILDWSKNITRKLKNRMVLNQDIVYFRGNDNQVRVLQNRCAHRGFPLHRSKLLGNDTIQCGYHGLTYDTEGKCIRIPSDVSNKKPKLSVQSYPVVDQFPMVWLWPGDPDKADPNLIPDYSWVNDDDWGYGKGYFHVKGNYLAIHENLLDITHFEYLHGAALGSASLTEAKVKIVVKENTVSRKSINHGDPVPILHKEATGLGDVPIIRHGEAKFVNPGFHQGTNLFEDPAGTNGGRTNYRPRILHFITPETNYTTHYCWIFARDFKPNNKKLDQYYNNATSKLFEEDKEAIEWIEELWATEDRPAYHENHVPADESTVKMRRIVHELSRLENL
ncbi:MAG: aromatic ring-hydroxylating dioxygenase subunit alpha [Pseudomonadota bacterium]|nr:aromatic ring-hydroxylating dioxygenase subunit alpha [Pseudomonadota bacterium]